MSKEQQHNSGFLLIILMLCSTYLIYRFGFGDCPKTWSDCMYTDFLMAIVALMALLYHKWQSVRHP